MTKHRIFILSILSLPSLGIAEELRSPSKNLILRTHEEDGRVTYSVDFKGEPIIARSRLGVELRGGVFSGAMVVTGSETRSHDETWEPVWGQFATYRDHFNELTLDLVEKAEPKRMMQVIFRAYDDGVAFRYAFPEQEQLSEIEYKKEWSQVSLSSSGPVAWYARGSTSVSGEMAFENLPKTCKTPFTARLSENCYVSLHEAGVLHSSDAVLAVGEDKRTLTFHSKSRQKLPALSPWRSIQIASTPAQLIESGLVLNLNEPNKLADTSWIRPGVTLWDWRNHGGKTEDGFEYGIDTESYLRYIDFAAEKGLPYVLIDAEWYGPEHSKETDPVTYIVEVDVPRVMTYAKDRGVGVWLYINDKALKHFDLDRTFSQYRKWGVVGIKHGFLNGGSQADTEFSVKVLEKCAEYKIMYVLHEPNKPTGLTRTYPHYLASEFVNSMLDAANRPPATPTDLCVFPVVHNLAGPVDRSCGLFDMDNAILRDKVHKQIPSTVVSQVAQCLVFPSGLLTLPDMPEAYERKADLFEFIQQLPMNYEDTRILEMEVGHHITLARRTGKTWLVGALANEKGREIDLPLDFLESDTTYQATVYEDAPESHYQFSGPWNKGDADRKKVPFKPVETKRELYQIRRVLLKKGERIKASIAPGGGLCLWLRPETEDGYSNKK